MFDYVRGTLRRRPRVEFPTLVHFIEDAAREGIQTVRVDLFHEVRPSELSFIYYVTPTLFVTAQTNGGGVRYEYTEALGTTAITREDMVDEVVPDSARARMEEVKQALEQSDFVVRHGRYAMPE